MSRKGAEMVQIILVRVRMRVVVKRGAEDAVVVLLELDTVAGGGRWAEEALRRIEMSISGGIA